MPVIYLMAMMGFIIIGVVARNPTYEQQNSVKATNVAEAMQWYHAKAVGQCTSFPATCPPGAPVTSINNDDGSNINLANLNQKYVTYVDPNYFITTFVPRNTPGGVTQIQYFANSGLINQALIQSPNGTFMAGPYQAATGTVASNTNLLPVRYPNGEIQFVQGSLTGVMNAPIPNNVAGVPILNGQPIIVTPRH